MELTRTHRILIGVVVAGAVVIAGIGFAGSYAAVRALAERKGFGAFSVVFPIGIDAGIVVLLSLDLLLTWIRIPFPLLRQTAWLLTAATIAFNGAAAWPDPLGVGMHAVIPILFVVSVEAARHAIGRIADITADKHMESVRLARWLLAFPSTFRLWRRMKLWELRSYDDVIRLEQDRLVYRARLRARFGRAWRRKAPVESLMPLRLARYGVPISQTAPAGLAAAGIEPALLEGAAAVTRSGEKRLSLPRGERFADPVATAPGAVTTGPADGHVREERGGFEQSGYDQGDAYGPGEPYEPGAVDQDAYDPGPYVPEPHAAAAPPADAYPEPPQDGGAPADAEWTGVTVPSGPGRVRPLGNAGPHSRPGSHATYVPQQSSLPGHPESQVAGTTEPEPIDDRYYGDFCRYVDDEGDFPNARQFGIYLEDLRGVRGAAGGLIPEGALQPLIRSWRSRYREEQALPDGVTPPSVDPARTAPDSPAADVPVVADAARAHALAPATREAEMILEGATSPSAVATRGERRTVQAHSNAPVVVAGATAPALADAEEVDYSKAKPEERIQAMVELLLSGTKLNGRVPNGRSASQALGIPERTGRRAFTEAKARVEEMQKVRLRSVGG